MKNFIIIVWIEFLFCGFSLFAQPDVFITTWKTNNPGISDSASIEIPTFGSGYNYNVDWNNDGVSDQFGLTGNVRHSYSTPGTYTIRIRGKFPRIYFADSGDKQKILSIDQWGQYEWYSMEQAFAGCINLKYNATDVPDLKHVQSMRSMFFMCANFQGDISTWDVSNVRDLSYAFYGASRFNSNLNDWDVLNVTNMEAMFGRARHFNRPLDKWNVGNVVNMNRMFFAAESFNQNIGNWDVSKVKNFESQFHGAASFNLPLGDWDVSSAETMAAMFAVTRFNQDISKWNVSKVVDMSSMFYYNRVFNMNIGAWNVSNVAIMTQMFAEASSFNQDITNWNVSHVNYMGYMFARAITFDQQIGDWDVSNVISMNGMFADADKFNQAIGNWDVSNVTSMDAMFSGCTSFNQNLSLWNVSKVRNMYRMFERCIAFNQDIGHWKTSLVENMALMFMRARIFNQDLQNWDYSKVKQMSGMFYHADSFDQDLGSWNLNNQVILDSIIAYSGLSCENYDKTIIGWNNNIELPFGLRLLAYNMKFHKSLSARQNLINIKNWYIIGDQYSDCNITKTKEDVKDVLIRVISNSGRGEIEIEFQNRSGLDGLQFNVIDISGRIIQIKDAETGYSTQKINIDNLENGLYLISVTANELLIGAAKFVKM